MNRSRVLFLILLPAMLLALPGCDAAKKALGRAASTKAALPPLEVKDITEEEFPAFIRQKGRLNLMLVYDLNGPETAAQTKERLAAEEFLKVARDFSDVVSVGRIDGRLSKTLATSYTPGTIRFELFREGSRVDDCSDGKLIMTSEFRSILAREAEVIRKNPPAAPAIPGSNPPRELAEKEFDSFTKDPNKLSVVVFHANWCGPCQKLKPVMAEVADSFPGVSEVGRFNVDNCRNLAGRLGVSSIPDVRFYRDGKEVGRFTGYRPDYAVRTLFQQHTVGLKAPVAPAPSKGSSGGGSMTRMTKDWVPPGMEKR
ncbi:thioredoxin family protein [Luteolibacter ambystomatis]|uniref:Thioredoxin family protein n=1 Tax=Luteolibacter ambystomatis TaxID=2824561 RepID=A0A975G8D5_9BACT|nr:thioredoxin family protein [Luteolibacter ambystomatis]QUE50636.1 thioredoxin family protein [Luteolibacter ambystomatis]